VSFRWLVLFAFCDFNGMMRRNMMHLVRMGNPRNSR
jgi:hypothetical protein